MSSYEVIADIGRTVLELLRSNINSSLVRKDLIDLCSPAEAVRQGKNLSVFLYGIVENPYMKDREVVSSGEGVRNYPPIVLDLYYLVTALSNADTLTEQKILGRVIQIFHDNGIIRDPDLQGGLAGSGQELRIVLNSLSPAEMYEIWRIFPTENYKTSISYKVTPSAIDSTRTELLNRVKEMSSGTGEMG